MKEQSSPFPYKNERFPLGYYRDREGVQWVGRTVRSLEPFNTSLSKAYDSFFGKLVTQMGISYITEEDEKGKVNKAALRIHAKPNLSRQELEQLINSIPQEIPADVPIIFKFEEDEIIAAAIRDESKQIVTTTREIIHYRKADAAHNNLTAASQQPNQNEEERFQELLDAVVGDIVVTYIDPKTGLRTTEQQLFPPSTTPSNKS